MITRIDEIAINDFNECVTGISEKFQQSEFKALRFVSIAKMTSSEMEGCNCVMSAALAVIVVAVSLLWWLLREIKREDWSVGVGESGKILYGSQSGTCQKLAENLSHAARMQGYSMSVHNLKHYEVEDLWREHFVVVLISTFQDGSPPDDAKWFCK